METFIFLVLPQCKVQSPRCSANAFCDTNQKHICWKICKVNGFLAVLQEHIFYNVDWIDVSRETEIGSSKQEASPSAGVNTGVVLVPCLRMEVHLYSYFRWYGYFWSPWVSFVTADEFSVRVTKITSTIGVSWVHSLPFYFWPI